MATYLSGGDASDHVKQLSCGDTDIDSWDVQFLKLGEGVRVRESEG